MSGACGIGWAANQTSTGITDAVSDGYVRGRKDGAWVIAGEPVAYNDVASDLITSVLPGAGPPASPAYPGSQIYLSLGTPGDPLMLDPGTYRSEVAIFLSGSDNTTELWFDVFSNGDPSELLPGGNFSFSQDPVGRAGSQVQRGGVLLISFPFPVSLFLDVHVAKGGGSGSVTFKKASLVLTRFA